jgi:plastocyanin
MKKTSRRNLLKVATAGSVAAGLGLVIKPETATPTTRAAGAHQHRRVSGPMANATVSFGQWQTDPPLDRFPNVSPIVGNNHALIPHEIRIKAGGSVNFIIAGFHQVIVYGDGTRPADINVNNTIAPTAGGPPLINDPRNRRYRGLDPSLQSQDRVEVVHFPDPGTFLVICGVFPHFVNDEMFGFVRVLP